MPRSGRAQTTRSGGDRTHLSAGCCWGYGPTLISMSDSRIVADHRIMGGVPCVRGTRVPVATIVGLVAQGRTAEEIVVDYPTLAADDVRAALEFAAVAVSERQIPLRTSA